MSVLIKEKIQKLLKFCFMLSEAKNSNKMYEGYVTVKAQNMSMLEFLNEPGQVLKLLMLQYAFVCSIQKVTTPELLEAGLL